MSVDFSAIAGASGASSENFRRSSRYKYVPSRHRGNQKKIGPLKERSHLLLPAPSSCSPVSSLCGGDSPITLSQLVTPSAESYTLEVLVFQTLALSASR